MADLATRLSLYQRLADVASAEEIETLASELSDRFGRLPKEVKGLLYSVRIKALATRAGLEAIATEHGQIILLPFEGMRFDKRRLEPLQREGLKTGLSQIRINHKKLADWC